ncbi:MAG: o-succinylbenzoate synthase [Halopseudomonas sp.]
MLSQHQRDAAIYRYSIPLNPALFCAGSLLQQRQGLLIRLSQGPAQIGFGEATPLPGFSVESLAECQQDLTYLANVWLNDTLDSTELSSTASPSARFGLSCALAELEQGPLNATINPGSSPLLQGDLSSLHSAAPHTGASVKLKLARHALTDEIELVQTLLQRTPGLRFRIDCNQGWSLQQAQQFIGTIPLTAIEYLEEPCTELDQSLRLSQLTGVPLALDESLRQPDFSLPEHPGLAALVLKPSLTGSLEQLQHWIGLANQRGLRAILSSSYESSLGLSQIAALAAQLTPTESPGLDTASAFSANLLRGGDPAKPTLPLEALTCLWRNGKVLDA